MKLRRILAAVGALCVLSTLSGCILVEKGGGGRRCDIPVGRPICDAHAGWHGR